MSDKTVNAKRRFKMAQSKKKKTKTAAKKSKKSSTKTPKVKKISKKDIIESSKAIESMYEEERKRIDDSVISLEKDRLKSYIELIEKRKGLLNLKKKKLDNLEKNLTKHVRDIEKDISKTEKDKLNEKSHFDRLYHLNEHLKNIEIQMRDIAESRKTLLSKEKELLKSTKKFFDDNKKQISEFGFSKKVNNISGILDKKTKVLAETSHLLNKDIRNVFKDKKILENITDNQLEKVNNINTKLKKLADEHSMILKKIQRTKTEGFEFAQEFRDLEQKKKSLMDELRKI